MFNDTIVIACGAHGMPGVCVETTDSDVREAIAQASTLKRKQVRKLHQMLVKNLKKMLPAIKSGKTVRDPHGELYTKEIFDADLVWLAVYDHVGNGKQIGLAGQPAFSINIQ